MDLALNSETVEKLEALRLASGRSLEEIIQHAIAVFDLNSIAPSEFSWKKFEFITTVQTGLINNAINRSLDDDAIENRAQFSPATVLFEMSEAFRAANMIPDTESARQGAWDFTMWKIRGDDDPAATMPSWFGPPDD